jgi:hypothetical protein
MSLQGIAHDVFQRHVAALLQGLARGLLCGVLAVGDGQRRACRQQGQASEGDKGAVGKHGVIDTAPG